MEGWILGLFEKLFSSVMTLLYPNEGNRAHACIRVSLGLLLLTGLVYRATRPNDVNPIKSQEHNHRDNQGQVAQAEDGALKDRALGQLPPAVAAEVLAMRTSGAFVDDGRFVPHAIIRMMKVGNQVWAVGASGAELVQPEVELPEPGVAVPEV